MSCPTRELLEAAHRVLAYLYHHQHVGLRYELCTNALRGHSDSDWAVRHSTTGWVFTHGLAAISWRLKSKPAWRCHPVKLKSLQPPKRRRRRSTYAPFSPRLAYHNHSQLLSPWTTRAPLTWLTTPSTISARNI
eukprot:2588897-Pleurochrysis_carterae.AAC.1